MNKPMLSLIIPVYNEEESLPYLRRALMDQLGKMNDQISDYEIWFVNDGSSDGSVRVIKEFIEKDAHMHLISFRKNFGKAAALQAGFRHCGGDVIITMDADLQDDPCELPNFLKKLDEGFDLVSGWKFNRLDPLEKRLPSKLFNRVTAHMSGIELHDFNCGFKAYRREVIKNIAVYGEFHRYIPVLARRKGFRIAEIKVKHNKREHGKSKYGFERYLRGLFDSMTTTFLLKYADRPLYLFGKTGLIMGLIGLLLFVLGLIPALNAGAWLPLLGGMGVLCGIMLFFLGLLANLVVDNRHFNPLDESHIEEII